jgi:hypothetical protein
MDTSVCRAWILGRPEGSRRRPKREGQHAQAQRTARCTDRVALKIVFGQACILEEAVQQWFLQRPVGMDRNGNGGMAGLLVTVMTAADVDAVPTLA